MKNTPSHESLVQRIKELEQEVSSLSEVEITLRESEGKYRTLIENIDVGVTMINPNHTIIMVNRIVAQWFGKSAEELIGKKCYQEFNKSDHLCANCPGTKAMLTGEAQEEEVNWKKFDGSCFTARNKAFPLYGENGDIIGCTELIEDITEKKQIKQKLIDAHAELELLLATSSAMIYRCKLSENFPATYISKNIQNELGYTPEEFLNEPNFWANNIHPEDKQRVLSQLSSLFENGHHAHECRFRHKNGSYRWMLDQAKIINNAEGTPSDIIGTFVDITKQKEAQEIIHQSKEELQFILDSLPPHIFIKDTQNNFTMVNESFARALGVTKGELVGSTAYDLFPHDIAEQYWQDDLEVIQSGKPKSDIVEPGKSSAGMGIYSTCKVPIKDETGNVIGILGVATDITLLKNIEQHLLKEKQFADSLIKSLPGVMYLFDQFGKFLRWNDNFQQVSGYSPEEIEGMNPLDFIALDDKNKVSKTIEKVFKKGAASVDAQIVTKNGEQIPYHLTGISFTSNSLKYVIGVGINIYDRIKAEQQKQNLIDKLQDALAKVKLLSGFLPICASCKKIRDDKGYWTQIESYIRDHSEAKFSHGFCPDCAAKLYPGFKL